MYGISNFATHDPKNPAAGLEPIRIPALDPPDPNNDDARMNIGAISIDSNGTITVSTLRTKKVIPIGKDVSQRTQRQWP